MRRILFFVLVVLSFAPSSASAQTTLQQTLQAQFDQVKAQSNGRLTTSGDITVEGNAVIYPTMNIKVADGQSSWKIPSLRMNFDKTAKGDERPFTLILPEMMQQIHNDGRTLRRIELTGSDIQGIWSIKENAVRKIDGKIANAVWQDVYSDTTTTAQNIAVQAMARFTGADKATVLVNAKADNFNRQPVGFSAGLMPKTLSLTGQIKSLPKALIVLGALVPGLQTTLAQMGTQLDVDNVTVTTSNGAKLSGNGWFKAAQPGAALPVSGRMNLEWQNLQQILTSLQKSFSEGAANRAESAQSMVLLMALQGMGKAVGQTTRYTVDLTPEGQIILNGQDVSGLFLGENSLLRFFQPKPADSSKNQPAKADSI